MNKALLNNYNKLSQGEQDILLALSIVYTSIGQTRFQQLLKLTGYFLNVITNIVAKPLREKLARLELIEVSDAGWVCSPKISETLMRKAAEKPELFNQMVNPLSSKVVSPFYNLPHLQEIRWLRFYLYQQKVPEFIAQL